MNKEQFISDLKDLLELDDCKVVKLSTVLVEFDEFDSLSILSLIAYVDHNFGERLSGEDVFKINDVTSLISLIGEHHFE
jgi:acyl carrier protein